MKIQFFEKTIKGDLRRRIITLLMRASIALPGTGIWMLREDPIIEIVEGAENCGGGTLTITGRVRLRNDGGHWRDADIISDGSRWRNYGHPSGTCYDVVLSLDVPRVDSIDPVANKIS